MHKKHTLAYPYESDFKKPGACQCSCLILAPPCYQFILNHSMLCAAVLTNEYFSMGDGTRNGIIKTKFHDK